MKPTLRARVSAGKSVPRGAHWALCLLLALLWAGCATSKVDWNSRIAIYTYDQAVMEMGPPDKYAKLTDGAVVAEWMTRRGYSGGFMYGYAYPYYGYPWHRYPPYYLAEPPSPDYFIRLTFGPDGKLQAWKRLAR